MKSILGLRGGIKFWTRDRDPLVEQTLSFVKGIAEAKPTEPILSLDSYKPETPERIDSDFMIAERAEFRRRVTQFRARQHTIRQNREQHYDAMVKKTRLILGNESNGIAL